MQKMSIPNIKLENDVTIPVIGLGTWRSPPEVIRHAIKSAIEVGYRHIDCAHSYGNEKDVGMAIEEITSQGIVKREDLFIVSKLWNTYHRPDLVCEGCKISIRNLRVEYLDSYLIHWPTSFKYDPDELYPKDKDGNNIYAHLDYIETWRSLEALVDAGLCRTIGLSNFNKRQIQRILEIARIPPAILQIECHPYLNQKRLIDYCQANNIVVAAYSPLGSPHTPYEKPWNCALMEHPKVLEIAKNHSKNPAQILIRYQTQRGNVVIPRSINKLHMASNLEACNFRLSENDMKELNSLDCNGRFMTWKVATGHPNHPFENDDF